MERKILRFDSNFIKVSFKFATDNKSAMDQVMAMRRAGAEPLTDPMLT